MGIASASAAIMLLTAQGLAPANGGMPPRVIEPETYPEDCVQKAERIEAVVIEFDTTAIGEPINALILSSTNSCLDSAALEMIAHMRFLRTGGADAGLNPRKDLRATIKFDRIKSPSAPERQFRNSVQRRLEHVLKDLGNGKDPGEALARLEKIEAKYGDDFSLAELAAHRILRAAARSDLGDVKGALEDFNAAEETTLTDVTFAMTGSSISELRDALKNAEKSNKE